MKWSDCKTEQAFKMEWIRRHKSDSAKYFCIETEETIKGFPDVLAVITGTLNHQFPKFFEFKKARKGWIEFQPTQPAFYKANMELDITVIALVENKGKNHIVSFPAIWLLHDSLDCYGLKGGLRLDLRPLCNDRNEVEE
jgi:hypothetical protein